VKNKIQIFCAVALLGAASAVSAIPVTGKIGMSGNFIAVDNSWNATSIASATGIDFSPNLFNVINPTGSFASVIGPGSITDFQFDPGLGIDDTFGGVTAVSSITNFWAVGDFTFELTSAVKQTTSSANFLDLAGTGIIRSTSNSFEDTLGSWAFNGENDNGTFTWSAGSAATVPEPTILALMGIGLMGFAVSRRKA